MHIDPRGVSDEADQGVVFYTSNISTGISGLSAFHPSHIPSGTINLTTLDRFCAEKEHLTRRFSEDRHRRIRPLRPPRFPMATDYAARHRLQVREFARRCLWDIRFSISRAFYNKRTQGRRLGMVNQSQSMAGVHDWRRFVEFPCELQNPKAWGNIIAVSSDELFHALLKLCRR